MPFQIYLRIYSIKNKEDETISDKIKDINHYYNTQRKKYLTNSILISKYIDKIQRSDSYIANYSKHIRSELSVLLNKKGVTILDWPVFLSFIIKEEIINKKKLINLDKSDILTNNYNDIK